MAINFSALLEINELTSTLSEVATNSTEITKIDDVIISADNSDMLNLTRFVVQKVLVPIIVLIGVAGNIISVCVLTHPSMKSSTNCYLTILAVFDTLYLVTCLTLSFNHYSDIKNSWIFIYWFPRGRVLSDMWANVSVCLTVTFTIERYIAVCHPMKGRAICTPKRARIIALVVAIIAIACTVPEFWEFETIVNTSENVTTYKNIRHDLGQSYEVGYLWFLVIVFTFVPLFSLCSFNSFLINSVYKASKIRRSMTNTTVCKPGDRNSAEQSRITLMLISVALVFIICQLPSAFLVIFYTYVDLAKVNLSENEKNKVRIGGNVTNLLLLVNAAINFILYSVMSTKFRRVFKRMVNRIIPGKKKLFANSDFSMYTGSSYFRGSTLNPSYRFRNHSFVGKDRKLMTKSSSTSPSQENWFIRKGSEKLLCSSESLSLRRSLLQLDDAHAQRSFPPSRRGSNDTSL